MKLDLNGKTKNKKRVGRGTASGSGKTSGRGMNGQKSRSGYNIPRGFEGGQNPLKHRIPKLRGFKSLNTSEVAVVNISFLNEFKDGETVSPEALFGMKKITKIMPVKILGGGELKRKIKVKGCKVSKSAEAKIRKAGGEIINV